MVEKVIIGAIMLALTAIATGIGDTPYLIDSDRKDNYPLMAPFDIYSVSISDAFSSITPANRSEIFPATIILTSMVVVVIGLELLVYFKKRYGDKSR